jgi:polysaccharide deacetylase 2 family uncharacterized protein YibQ
MDSLLLATGPAPVRVVQYRIGSAASQAKKLASEAWSSGRSKKALVFLKTILYKLAMAKKKQLPARGGSKGKGSRYDRAVMLGILVAVIAIGLTLWGPLKKFQLTGEKGAGQAQRKQPAAGKKPDTKGRRERPDGRETGEEKKQFLTQGTDRKTIVAIVVDDLGQDLKTAREIASLPADITFAVMPGLPQSLKVAELAKQNGRELLLHLPMEHRGKNGKRAPGMLRGDMTPMDFLNVLTDDLASVPGAVGVNNHEGSLLTENKEAMKFLMAELKARDLLFLDSLTSAGSVAYATAKEFGLKAVKRDVFLDNDSSNAGSIRKQLEELARIAREHGSAVGIGHPHPATISELRLWIEAASNQGVTIVPISRIAR